MKTAISIPDDLFESAETYAKGRGFTRSELYTTALRHFLRSHRDEQITQQLNSLYTSETNSPGPVTHLLQTKSLPQDDW